MATEKFKILCNGHFIGFLFISADNQRFPNLKVATIWPFEKRGSWTIDDLEIVGQEHITDIYEINTSDEEIKNHLIQRTKINPKECNSFEIVRY